MNRPYPIARPVRNLRRPAAFLLVLVAACPALRAADAPAARGGREVRTEHYDLYAEAADGVDAVDAGDIGRMLEQFHALAAVAFGRAPEGRLRVELYADKSGFDRALKADDQGSVDAGGYYAPETKKAYLYVQPSEYYTRQLILHECTHQFHFLSSTRNKAPKAEWYIEGLAEYYGMHTWDGHTLKLGATPVMTLEDYPKRAAEHFEKDFHGDFRAVVTGTVKTHWPTSWAVVHFLMNNHPEEFRALARKLDDRADPTAAWDGVFPGRTDELGKEFVAWLAKIRQPWEITFVAWQQWGDRFEGKSDTTGVALLKDTPTALAVGVEAAEGDGDVMPGLVFGYRGKDDYYAVQTLPNRNVRLVHRRGGRWLPAVYFPAKARKGANDLALSRRGDKWTLSLNGAELASLEVEGRAGLYVQEGRAYFKVRSDPPVGPRTVTRNGTGG